MLQISCQALRKVEELPLETGRGSISSEYPSRPAGHDGGLGCVGALDTINTHP